MVALPQWLEYVENQIGFVLPATQHKWLEQAIDKTADKHGLEAVQLWHKVQQDRALRQELFDAILILESRFFRHKPSIKFITEIAKNNAQNQHSQQTGNQQSKNSQQTAEARNNSSFRIWSVGCSEGQEVWTLAMSLMEKNLHDFHIIGTDISTKAIKSAKKAVYSVRERREVPEEYQSYTEDVIDSNSQALTKWTIAQDLRQHADFVLNNIFMPSDKQIKSSKLLLSYDVIICQNMLIYFRQFDQRDILSRLVKQCKVGGHIVLAPGEAYFWKHPQMKKVANEQINAWIKVR